MIPKYFKKDCHKFREIMSPYIDGRITQDEKQALESHLASCHECRQELEALRTTVKLLHRLPQEEVPRFFNVVESKPVAVPYIFRRLCWASAIAALILVLFSAGDLFHVYPEKSTKPSEQLAITLSGTISPTIAPNFFMIPGDSALSQDGTPPQDIPKSSSQDKTTPIPSTAADDMEIPTTAPDTVPAEEDTAVSTESTKEGYRWPVHQIELAILGFAVVLLSAAIIVWRKGERSSTQGG